jgi:plastocyanin
MRFIGKALVASAVVLGACGGGDKKEEAPAAAAPAATPAAAPAAAAAAGGAAPVTGATIEVKMIGDEKGYRFEPATVKAKTGDAIKFIFVSGGPHNVAFDAATVPADVKAQLDANFGTNKMAELSSNMMMNAGDSVIISLGGIKAGTYDFHCTPHLAMNMKGKLIVQ